MAPLSAEHAADEIPAAEEAGVGAVVLWRTDGTEAGTVLLRTFVRDPVVRPDDTELPEIHDLTVFAGHLWFAALDSTHGRELWSSDGPPEGTALSQDIAPGEESSSPEHLTPGGSRLWLIADDGLTGREVWMLPLDE